MTTMKAGDRVKLELEGRLNDGKVVVETKAAAPYIFTVGRDEVFPRLEEAVKQLGPGDTATVKLKDGEAFGGYDQSKIVEVERSRFTHDEPIRVGDVVTLNAEIGEPVKGRIVSLENATIKVDTNHPLAGEDLTFDLKVLEVA